MDATQLNFPGGSPMFRVTKQHTAGILAGLSTTETTSVEFPVGFVCAKAIGGGAFVVTACERVQ